MLEAVLSCIGGAPAACVCSTLAEDYAAWLGGMPDLLLWHPGALTSTTPANRDV